MRGFLTSIIVFLLGILVSSAQEITIINQYPDSSAHERPKDYFLKKTTKHVLVINYYEPASSDQSARLKELIGGALNFYIDQCIELEDEKPRLLKNQPTMMREMDQIVADAVKYYNFKLKDSFKGFSDEIGSTLREIEKKKFRNSQFYDASHTERKKELMAYQFLQNELNSLKLKVNEEIGNLANEELMVMSKSTSRPVDKEELISEIVSFKKHDPLKPLEIDYSDATVTLLASEDEWGLPDPEAEEEGNEPDEDFASKVFSMLERNEKKLDNLQSEINMMKLERQLEAAKAQQKSSEELQLQIDQLRSLIVKMVNDERPDTEEIRKVATYNLPKAIDINFGLGSKSLDMVSEFKLNEVIDLLGHNPTFKLVITGYADKVGNSKTNLALSQARARAVKTYISNSGIEPSRLIVNFFGDQNSTSVNPDDRKVVLEFVPL